jgi:hypothetical protein
MNEQLIGNAVKFLSDPSVRNSPAEKQLSFLRGKCLSDDEIEESYRRAGLSSPLSAQGNSSLYNQTSSYQSGNNTNNYTPYSGPSSFSYDMHQQQQDHIFQLARSSNTARWLLLFAVIASTLTFLARNVPRSLYTRFFNWFQKSFYGNASPDKFNAEQSDKIIELTKKVDQIRNLIENLSRRQNELEYSLTSFRYLNSRPNQNEYNDCLEEGETIMG